MEALQNLGLDLWGIILYLVNFGVILYVLHRWVYKPLLKHIDERREVIRKNVKEAEMLRKNFESEAKKQKAENEAYITDARAKIAEATKFAKRGAKEIIADADERREAMLAEAAEQIESMKSGIVKASESEMKQRIERIVLHVLQNSVPEKAVKQSVDDAVKAVLK